MELVMTVIANLLFPVGIAYCLINFTIVLHNCLRGTHASMVPLMGTIFMMLACLLLPQANREAVPAFAVVIFALFDLSTLPTLLMLPFYLLLRALRGAEAPPLLPAGAWAILTTLYMVLIGFGVLYCWVMLFITGGATLPNQP